MKHAIKLWPLLGLYLAITLVLASDSFQFDESRYVMFAENLAHGFYSPKEEINLWNGPGYPLLLAPFALAGIPWLFAKMLNACLLFGAVALFFQTLKGYLPEGKALILAVLFGLYPPFWRELHLLLTETFSYFLMCAFVCLFCALHRATSRLPLLIVGAAACMAMLALTRVVFGYVIVAALLLLAGGFVLAREKAPFRRSVAVFALALLFCAPYLLYTQQLTGKWFYWSNAGGLQLYWMTSPTSGELGSWIWPGDLAKDPRLEAEHGTFFDEISHLPPVMRDQVLQSTALNNLAQYPGAYLRNWLANVGRMLFSYPFTYTEQKLSTYFYLLPNMFLVVLFIFSLYPGFVARRRIPREIWILLLLGLIAFASSTLVCAYDRMFRPLVPILGLWLSFVGVRLVTIEIRREAECGNGNTPIAASGASPTSIVRG
jgi:hypothetical protein